MNVRRIVILAVAAVAAGVAALLVRNMLGGGTPPVEASLPLQATDVLVAASDIEPGNSLDVNNVRWQPWPKGSLSSTLVTKDVHPNAQEAINGAVARTPILSGEPITENKLARIGQAGFMSAMLSPGKRAMSIPISTETGAGGFILPNDHVDVILTRQVAGGAGRNFRVETVLNDVRVLAIDQIFKDEKDSQTAVGKVATLELAPDEAELISLAQAQGTLSLALRGLAENVAKKPDEENAASSRRGGAVAVIRYGMVHSSTPAGRPQ